MRAPRQIRRSLEGRALLSAAPSHFTAAAKLPDHAVLTAGLTVGAESTVYQGTATDQSGKTSAIEIVLTDIRGGRAGILYVNNNDGSKVPVAFTIKSNLTFSFKFRLSGDENAVAGKLSANGHTITATWTSLSAAGVKGHGSAVATRLNAAAKK